MNLFQSEEHVRRWSGFDPSTEEGIRPVADLAELFSLPLFRERLVPDYLLRLPELGRDMPAAFERIGRSTPFWRR